MMRDRGDDPQAASDRPRGLAVDGVLSLDMVDLAIADEPLGRCRGICWIDEAWGVPLSGTDHRTDGSALGH